jgi:hypothetical protein
VLKFYVSLNVVLFITAEDISRLRRENEELRNDILRYRRIVDGAGNTIYWFIEYVVYSFIMMS